MRCWAGALGRNQIHRSTSMPRLRGPSTRRERSIVRYPRSSPQMRQWYRHMFRVRVRARLYRGLEAEEDTLLTVSRLSYRWGLHLPLWRIRLCTSRTKGPRIAPRQEPSWLVHGRTKMLPCWMAGWIEGSEVRKCLRRTTANPNGSMEGSSERRLVQTSHRYWGVDRKMLMVL